MLAFHGLSCAYFDIRMCLQVDPYFGWNCLKPHAMRLCINKSTILDTNFDEWYDFWLQTGRDMGMLLAAKFVAKEQHRKLCGSYIKEFDRVNAEYPICFPIDVPYELLPKCPHCGTWRFANEKRGSLISWCCSDGHCLRLPMLQPLPDRYRELLLSNAQGMVHGLRHYNSRLSFATIGVKYGSFEEPRIPGCIRVSGLVYQRILHAGADAPLRYYVHDPEFDIRSNRPEVLAELQNLVETNNPLGAALRQLGAEEHENHVLALQWNSNAQNASELGSVVFKSDFGPANSRSIMFYRNSGQFAMAFPHLQRQIDNGYFVEMQNPLTEVLLYPLLFWGGMRDSCSQVVFDNNRNDHEDDSGELKSTKMTVNKIVRFRTVAPERNALGELDLNFCLLTQWAHKNNKTILLPFNRFQLSSRLAGEWLISSFLRIEDARLAWQRRNQNLLTGANNSSNNDIGVHLHSSLHGSPAHMAEMVANALHLVFKREKPFFFITVTCNPNWPEILSGLRVGQTASDNPILTCRVFKLKLDAFLKRLTNGLIFQANKDNGTAVRNVRHLEMNNGRRAGYIVHVIEYQLRGLPHTHIAYQPACNGHNTNLMADSECEWVDKYVCAQLPSNDKSNWDLFRNTYGLTDAEIERLRHILKKHNIHDSGRNHNRNAGQDAPMCYNDQNKCSKFFPKENLAKSHVNEKGYVQYKRLSSDDGWVVPYNPHIALLLDSHHNIEIAATVNIIFYLYKYLFKGSDKAHFHLKQYHREHSEEERDKIREWLIGRYVSSMHAAWRILNFPMYSTWPSVDNIKLHLPNNERTRKGCSDVDKYMHRPRPNVGDRCSTPPPLAEASSSSRRKKRQRTDAATEDDASLKTCKYCIALEMQNSPLASLSQDEHAASFYEKFTVSASPHAIGINLQSHVPCHTPNGVVQKVWFYNRRRDIGNTRGGVCRDKMVRMQTVPPSQGELFYMRLLLLHKMPLSWEDLRTHEGQEHVTFQDAANAMGLLDNFNEAILTFIEAMESHRAPCLLRSLFTTLTLQGYPTADILDLNTHPDWVDGLMTDYLEITHGNINEAYNHLLADLDMRLQDNGGKNMSDFGLPMPRNASTELERERLKYYEAEQRMIVQNARSQPTWNHELEAVFCEVDRLLISNEGKLLFVIGKAGVGKTTLNRILLAHCRGMGKIGLVCAPTALAAGLYNGGVTCHDLCKLNVVEDEVWDEYKSYLHKYPGRCALLKECSLLIIDEIFNVHRANFMSILFAMQSVRESTHETGGLIIVCTGDNHQIPPVVKNGNKTKTVNASVVALPNWSEIHKMRLNIPQRTLPSEVVFRSLLDEVGADLRPHVLVVDDTPLISLPNLQYFLDVDIALTWALPTLDSAQRNSILACSNARVDELNNKMQERNPNPLVECQGSTFLKSSTNEPQLVDMMSPELFFNVNCKHTPGHVIGLKVGDVCFLMASISKRDGLNKNQRVRINEIHKRLIGATLLLDNGQTKKCVIPRIRFDMKIGKGGLVVTRLQFPLKLAYAMTFNKSQGQTFERVLIDSRRQILNKRTVCGGFTHGHTYVALGRVRSASDVRVLVDDFDVRNEQPLTGNVVYSELLNA